MLCRVERKSRVKRVVFFMRRLITCAGSSRTLEEPRSPRRRPRHRRRRPGGRSRPRGLGSGWLSADAHCGPRAAWTTCATCRPMGRCSSSLDRWAWPWGRQLAHRQGSPSLYRQSRPRWPTRMLRETRPSRRPQRWDSQTRKWQTRTRARSRSGPSGAGRRRRCSYCTGPERGCRVGPGEQARSMPHPQQVCTCRGRSAARRPYRRGRSERGSARDRDQTGC